MGGVFLSILLLPVIALATWHFPQTILGPILAARRENGWPLQFFVGDLLWLCLLLHPLLTVAAGVDPDRRLAAVVLVVFLFLMIGGFWIGGIGTLSDIRVVDFWRRGAFLVIILPAAIGGTVAVPVVVILGIMLLFSDDATAIWRAISVAMVLSPAFVALGCRRLARWVVAGAAPIEREIG